MKMSRLPIRVQEKLSSLIRDGFADYDISSTDVERILQKGAEHDYRPSVLMSYTQQIFSSYDWYYPTDTLHGVMYLIDEMWKVLCDETRLHMV